MPSTSYDVTCTGMNPNGYMMENPLEIYQVVQTTPAQLSVESAKMKDEVIEVMVDSNLDISILCLLFDSKGRIQQHLFNQNNNCYCLKRKSYLT